MTQSCRIASTKLPLIALNASNIISGALVSRVESHSTCSCDHGVSRGFLLESLLPLPVNRLYPCFCASLNSFYTLLFIPLPCLFQPNLETFSILRSPPQVPSSPYTYGLYLINFQVSSTMRSLRKRHSWPPLRKPRAFYANENVDEDPFAYFISPAEDRDIFTGSYLTAGITSRQRSRSLSPVTIRRKSHTKLSASKSPTLRLKKWIERMERCYFHRTPPGPQPQIPIIEVREPKHPEIATSPIRGRRDSRSSTHDRISQTVRTSPRKPRVWREPSESIWTVVEEGEDVGLGITT